MTESRLLVGWKEIAGYLRMSERWVRSRKGVMLAKEPPVIFFRRKKGGKLIVCGWTSDLEKWRH